MHHPHARARAAHRPAPAALSRPAERTTPNQLSAHASGQSRRAFSMRQLAYLRQHYADRPPAHFAERFGVGVAQVYKLAQRHGIKRRAPNGAPVWRQAA